MQAAVFYVFAEEGPESPDGTSCFAVKDLSKNWTAWDELPIIESLKIVDVGE